MKRTQLYNLSGHSKPVSIFLYQWVWEVMLKAFMGYEFRDLATCSPCFDNQTIWILSREMYLGQ
jgi:hypothetical protein